MLTVVFWIFATLFLVKVAWNLTIPYELARRNWDPDDGLAGRGISWMPYLEWSIFPILLVLAGLAGNGLWIGDVRKIAVWGLLLIVGSYIHLILMGMFLGWIVSRRKHH